MVFFNVSSDTFIVYKIGMRITGVWPLATSKCSSLIIYLFFLMLEIVTIITRLIDPYGNSNEQKVGKAYFTNSSWFATIAIMRFILRANGNKMITLIESTIDDWSSITDPKEREIMKRHDKFGSVVLVTRNIGFIVLCIVQAALAAIYPSLFPVQDELTWAFPDHIIWNIVSSGSTIIVAIVDHLTVNLGMVLLWSFAFHLSAQFKILTKQFQEFLLIKDKKEGRRVFRHLVDRHNQLLDLSVSLEDCFCFFMGINIIRSQIIICLFASQLGYAIKSMEFAKILDILKNIGILLFLPIMYYSAGDHLTKSSEEIGEALKQCNWYDLSKDSITNFSIVIARCRKPSRLTLLKFHQLNLSNLKHTLDALYSYVSLIVGIVTDG